MPLDTAFEKAIKDLEGCAPFVVAAKSGANYEDGKFTLSFFDRTFLIDYPGIRVEEVAAKNPPPEWLQVLLLHYLATARGNAVADQWVSYRNLPDAYLFDKLNGAMASLTHTFSNDIEGFRKAGLSLGGSPMTRTGDAAFRFLALPRIPMACILYLGDEEVASSISILYDAVAPHYLPTYDLFLLGNYLSTALERHKS